MSNLEHPSTPHLPTCQKVWGHPTSWWHWLLDLIGHCEASQPDTLSDFVGIFPARLLSSFSTLIGLVILDVRHSSEPKYAKVLKEEHILIFIYTDPCGTFFFAGSVTFVGKICWRNLRELHVWWVSNRTLTNDTWVTPHSDSMFLLPVLALAHSQPPVLIPKPPSYLETSLPLRLPPSFQEPTLSLYSWNGLNMIELSNCQRWVHKYGRSRHHAKNKSQCQSIWGCCGLFPFLASMLLNTHLSLHRNDLSNL